MMIKKLKERTGAISIFTIIVLVFLLPLAFWVGIELPKMHEANQRVKDAVDSASSSSVTMINEKSFADSKILLDKVEIEHVAKEILGQKMGITYHRSLRDFEIPPGSSVSKDTKIEVAVQTIDDDDLVMINGVRQSKEVYSKLGSWSKKVNNPIVVVEAKITFKKIGFMGNDMTVTQVGMSQVRLSEPMPE